MAGHGDFPYLLFLNLDTDGSSGYYQLELVSEPNFEFLTFATQDGDGQTNNNMMAAFYDKDNFYTYLLYGFTSTDFSHYYVDGFQ
jgi:hypothetical protein